VGPIVKSLFVAVEPSRAFAAFTQHMGEWWGKGIGTRPLVKVVVEPHPEGRWFEVDDEGVESQWGRVLAWEPPHRLLLAWQIGADWTFHANFETEVELRFLPEADGTRVELEHRCLERFGTPAATHAAQMSPGWSAILSRFAACAAAEKALPQGG
jgi:uncharacterized protein YndB with AHSA1/START domain